jgi:hypothetical protein
MGVKSENLGMGFLEQSSDGIHAFRDDENMSPCETTLDESPLTSSRASLALSSDDCSHPSSNSMSNPVAFNATDNSTQCAHIFESTSPLLTL